MRTLFMAVCICGATLVDNELARLFFILALGMAAYTQGLDDESDRYTTQETQEQENLDDYH